MIGVRILQSGLGLGLGLRLRLRLGLGLGLGIGLVPLHALGLGPVSHIICLMIPVMVGLGCRVIGTTG